MFNDGFPLQLRPLDHVVPRQEIEQLRVQFFGKSLHQFPLVVHQPGVADQAPQLGFPGGGISFDTLTDVVCRIEAHHFAGTYNIDLLGLALPDRHGKSPADYIPQHVVQHIVQPGAISSQLFQQIDGADDTPSGAAHAGFRSAGFYRPDTLETCEQKVIQFHILLFLFPHGIQHRALGHSSQDQPGRIRFGVAAHDHQLPAHLGQSRRKILGGRRFPDTALSVNSNLSHILNLSFSA